MAWARPMPPPVPPCDNIDHCAQEGWCRLLAISSYHSTLNATAVSKGMLLGHVTVSASSF
jgi:hypothetical protein